MKKIILKPSSGDIFLNNKVFGYKSSCNAYYKADETLSKKGIKIDTFDVVKKEDEGDVAIFNDIPYPWQLSEWRFLLAAKAKKALFVYESPIINPFNHLKFLHRFFDVVYTWNDNQVDGGKRKKFFVTQMDLDSSVTKKDFKAKKLISFINSNKAAPWLFKLISPAEKDLYYERIKVSDFFEEKVPSQFDLFGKGWNEKKKFGKTKYYSVFRGPVSWDDKLETLSNYKFSVCYENSIANGYITEKIFDCFKSKCVPLYLGAPNITEFIPKETFVDVRDFNDYEELFKFITSMDETTHENYIAAGQSFINSEETRKRWSQKSFFNLIVSLTKEKSINNFSEK